MGIAQKPVHSDDTLIRGSEIIGEHHGGGRRVAHLTFTRLAARIAGFSRGTDFATLRSQLQHTCGHEHRSAFHHLCRDQSCWFRGNMADILAVDYYAWGR